MRSPGCHGGAMLLSEAETLQLAEPPPLREYGGWTRGL
jgi:hypothetical protein